MALEPEDTLDEADFDEAFGQADSPPIAIPLMPPPQQRPQPQQMQPPPQQRLQPQQMQPQPQMQRPPQPQMQRPQPQMQRPQPQMQRPPQPQHRPMSQPQHRPMPQQVAPYRPQFALPLPPGLGQAVPEEGFFTRKVGGLPVWAWGLIVAGGGTVAYLTMRDGKKDDKKKKIEKNSAAVESVRRLGSGKRSSGGWSPSRGTFCRALEKKFGGKFEKVYDDAEDAVAASFKTVSPLINIKARPGFAIDKTFEAFCKADGLHPVAHDGNEIGLYPADGTAKGREWEEYVDMLRDDGQTV